MKLSLVIPFYNEETNLKKVIGGLSAVFKTSGIDYELILVNNGSKDKTAQLLAELAAENAGRFKVITVPENLGYGWGVINGLNAASGDYIGHMGGDGQIKPEDVLTFYERIRDSRCDMVKAARVTRRDPLIRKVLSFFFNALFYLAFKTNTKDINGSPKIYKKEYLPIFRPVSKDWFLDAEEMIKAGYLKLKISEVPVEFLEREGGKSNVHWDTVLEFLKNMYDYRFGKGMKEWKRQVLKS
jgi:glycosyltransferase involved in cell wall biosynthesis